MNLVINVQWIKLQTRTLKDYKSTRLTSIQGIPIIWIYERRIHIKNGNMGNKFALGQKKLILMKDWR